jgi:hypothetical protein
MSRNAQLQGLVGGHFHSVIHLQKLRLRDSTAVYVLYKRKKPAPQRRLVFLF